MKQPSRTLKYTPSKRSKKGGDQYTKGLQQRLLTRGVESTLLKVDTALEIAGQRMKYSAASTPLTMLRKSEDAAEETSIFLGDAEEAFEKLKEFDKDASFNWEISVMMGLSTKTRRLVVGVNLYTPENRGLDWKIQSRAEHLEDKDAAVQVYSRKAGQWMFLLEEHERRGKDIPEEYPNIITIAELITVIRGVGSFKSEAGAVDGDPHVRMTLDGHQGIAFRLSSLDDQEYLDLIGAWLSNSVMFLKNNRELYWDAEERAYAPKKNPYEKPPHPAKFSKILEELGNGL